MPLRGPSSKNLDITNMVGVWASRHTSAWLHVCAVCCADTAISRRCVLDDLLQDNIVNRYTQTSFAHAGDLGLVGYLRVHACKVLLHGLHLPDVAPICMGMASPDAVGRMASRSPWLLAAAAVAAMCLLWSSTHTASAAAAAPLGQELSHAAGQVRTQLKF